MPVFEAESKLIEFLDRLDQEGEDSQGDLKKRIADNMDQVRGKQWKGSESPYFLYNIIESSVEDKTGKLSETKPRFNVLPFKEGIDDVAKILTQVTSGILDRRKVEYQSERIAAWGALSGVAFVGTPYNPNLDNGLGDVDFVIKDPRACVTDVSVVDATKADLGEYIRVEDFLPLDVIREQFPGRGALVKPDERLFGFKDAKPIDSRSMIRAAYDRIVNMKKGDRKVSVIPKAILKEYFIKDRRKNIDDLGVVPLVAGITKWAPEGTPFPGGRRILRAGEVILDDTYNPYWDGMPPLDMMSWKIDLETAWGADDIQGVKRMQEAVNRLGDAYTKTAILNSVVRLILDAGALSSEERNKLSNEVGQIIVKNPGREVNYAVPPLLQNDVVAFVDKLIEYIRRKMGVQQIPTEKDVPSIITGPAIEGLQLMVETPIRTAARRVEEFYQRIGQKLISRVFQYYDCCDPTTECLTKRGWLKYDALNSEDEIYTLNPKTERGEWSPILKLNVYDYVGPMYRINGRKIDAMVTPNHKWWVKGSVSLSERTPEYANLRPVETANLRKWHVFPSGAPLDVSSSEIRDEFVELMGWIVTEGHYSVDKRCKNRPPSVIISQSERANLDKCEMIRNCIKSNGIVQREGFSKRDSNRRFIIRGKMAKEIVAAFPDKRLSYDFIFSLNHRQLKILHDTMILGDGTIQLKTGKRKTHNTVFYSSDAILIEQFQTIATLCGYSTRIGSQNNVSFAQAVNASHRSERYGEGLFVRTSAEVERPGITWHRLSQRTEIVQYSGKVWCPTTTNGTWIARRNGRVCVTGNSNRMINLIGPTNEWKSLEFERMKILVDKKGRPRSQEDIQKAWRDYYFAVEPGSSLAITKQSRVAAKAVLVQMGILSPLELLAEVFANPKEKLDEAQKAKDQGLFDIIQGASKGGGGPASQLSAAA